MNRNILARIIVALVVGAGLGYVVGVFAQREAERGRTLTMKEYVSEFEAHKQELVKSELPMVASIAGVLLMTLVFFGFYELLVAGVDKVLALADRGRRDRADPGTPPPW